MAVNDMHGYGLFQVTDEQVDKEILYSMSPPPLKKGGMLRAGEGLLEAGTILSYDAESGRWLKYDNTAAENETQTLTESGTITGGTYTITFRGETTTALAANANAATVQAALEALPTIGVGNIAVTGGPVDTAPFTLEFQNDLGSQDVPQVTVDASALTGTTPGITVATTNEGVAGGAVAAAVLAKGADAGTDPTAQDVAINVYFRGSFKTDQLVGLDASAITDLNARQPATAYNLTIIP